MPDTLDKWAVLDQIGWDPHSGQLAVAESTARNRVVSAGRRFGKSDIGGHELVPEALFTASVANDLKLAGKRREFWIVGPEYSDSEKEFRVLWNELTKLDVPFDRPGTYNDPISGNMHISLWNGAFQVHGKSAKYPTSLVGEGLSGVILAEAAKLKEKVWTKYIRPTLADFHGWSLMTSTPEGKNWFYDYWQRGQNPNETEWDSWRMPSWLNPYVYRTPTLTRDVKLMFEFKKLSAFKNMTMKEIFLEHNAKADGTLGHYKEPFQVDPEILSLMDDLTPEAFNQEIGADFTEFVGRVFKDFDEEVHVRPLTWNPAWETYAAVDYGFTNPNVWLLIQVGPWGEVNVMEEIYEHGLTAIEFADLIIDRGLCPAGLRAFYPDPSSPGDTRILEQKLRVRARGGTGGELKDRIDAIRLGLKESPLHVPRGHIDRRPKLLINQGHCPKTVHEFNEYRYPDQKNDLHLDSLDKPLKKDDHTPEALGRFWKGYFGTPQQTRSRQRVTKAKVKR